MTNWTPGIVALVVGVVVAAVLVFLRRRDPAAAQVDDELVRLDRTVDALVEQLRELNADRHLYDAEKLQSEVARLEREAADAMRARDAHKREASAAPKQNAKKPAPANGEGFAAKHPQLLGALYGGGTVLFFAVTFFFLTSEQKAAPNAATGDARYEAVLVLSAIAISFGDSEQLLQAWELYMRQNVPRRRPPQLQRAIEWLEKTTAEEQ